MRLPQMLSLIQGWYYLLTGLWPLVHRSSFEAVTGPKHDYWLVVMVGLLACSIGLTLLLRSSGQPLKLVELGLNPYWFWAQTTRLSR